jgi:hypothetical protein
MNTTASSSSRLSHNRRRSTALISASCCGARPNRRRRSRKWARSEHFRPKAGQCLQRQFLIAIEVDVKDEERNHDGKYAIAERLQICVSASRPPLQTIGPGFVSRIRADTSCSQTSRPRCRARGTSSKKPIAAVSRGGLSSSRRKKGASTCDGLVAAVAGRLRCDLRAGSPLRIVERPRTPVMR